MQFNSEKVHREDLPYICHLLNMNQVWVKLTLVVCTNIYSMSFLLSSLDIPTSTHSPSLIELIRSPSTEIIIINDEYVFNVFNLQDINCKIQKLDIHLLQFKIEYL